MIKIFSSTDQISWNTMTVSSTNNLLNNNFVNELIQNSNTNTSIKYLDEVGKTYAITNNNLVLENNISSENDILTPLYNFGGATQWTQIGNAGSINVIENNKNLSNNLWVAGGNNGHLRTSTNGTTWVTRTSNFGNTSIHSIVFRNNLWVAGGFTQLRTSTDAITWVTRTSNFAIPGMGVGHRQITFGNNLWVIAGANDGQLRTSTDTITWVTQTSNFGFQNIRSVDFGNQTFVIVGTNGNIRTSTNGTTWVTRTSNFGNTNINSVVFRNNLWVAGGYGGQLRTSTDAITWVTRTSNFGVTQIRSIDFGSQWVAGGNDGELRTSTDAITWVTINSVFTSWIALAYGNNLWIISNGNEVTYISNDIPLTLDNNIKDIFKTNRDSKLLLENKIYNLTQGIPTFQFSQATNEINKYESLQWTSINNKFISNVTNIGYGNNLWTIVGNLGQVGTSTDAITWVTRNSNFGNTQITSLGFGNNNWVIGGNNGQLRTSTDAITWVTRTSNFSDTQIRSIAFGNNLWVAGGFNGRLITSTDAITWVTRNSNFGNTIVQSIAFGNNLWVAGGYIGQLRTSTDAITWVTRNSNFGNTVIRSIAFGNGLWVAGGNNTQLRTSTDAINWVTQFISIGIASSSFALNKVFFGNNLWVVGSENHRNMFISTNAIVWTETISNSAVNTINYDGVNTWVIPSDTNNSRIYRSTNDYFPNNPFINTKHVLLNNTGFILTNNSYILVENDAKGYFPINTNISDSFQNISFKDPNYLLQGTSSFYTSTNLTTWTTVITPSGLINIVSDII